MNKMISQKCHRVKTAGDRMSQACITTMLERVERAGSAGRGSAVDTAARFDARPPSEGLNHWNTLTLGAYDTSRPLSEHGF
jgi:hypothetical protein